MGFKERLTKEWLFWDGGTGSVLQSWGLQAGELPETWNIIHYTVGRNIGSGHRR